jgi:hypothetical protein
MKFARFGGLSPVIQKQYDTSDEKTFHNPPRKRGLYAFPQQYIETFLLGATDDPKNLSHKTQWLKNEFGEKIRFDDFYDKRAGFSEKTFMYPIKPEYVKLLKKYDIKQKDIRSYTDTDGVNYITILKKPRVFEYDGELWHHLGNHLKPHQILGTSGSWTLSDMDDYKYALMMEIRDTKRQMLKSWSNYMDMTELMKKDPYKRMFAKDHLEVFIENL